MEKCNIPLSKIKNKNKKKYEQSKKHEKFSNLILNENIVRNREVDKFRDIIHPYYDKHEMKFDNFTVCVMWKKNDILINKSFFPSIFTLEKAHLFKTSMIVLPIVIGVSPLDFLDTVDKDITEDVDKIDITTTSDLRDMTF